MTTPPEFCGLWKRNLMVSDDTRDETTVVYYLQTSSGVFADIRIPENVLKVVSWTTDDNSLLLLSKMKGFGGTFECNMDSLVCKWNRKLDFQPTAPPDEYLPDESNFRFDGNYLIETGIHEVFEEVWERMTPLGLSTFAFHQATVNSAESLRDGILVIVGNYFIFIFNRHTDLPSASSLETIIKQELLNGNRDAALDKLQMLIEFGEISSPTTSGDWTVLYSTIPNQANRSSSCLRVEWQSVSNQEESYLAAEVSWLQQLRIHK